MHSCMVAVLRSMQTASFKRRLVLGGDDASEGLMMGVAGLAMVVDYSLKPFYQPVNYHPATKKEEAEGREEEPAIVHGGGMVHHPHKSLSCSCWS